MHDSILLVSNQYHAAISIFSSKTDKAAFLKTALTDCPGLPVMMGCYGRFYYSGRFRRFRRYGRFLVTPVCIEDYWVAHRIMDLHFSDMF